MSFYKLIYCPQYLIRILENNFKIYIGLADALDRSTRRSWSSSQVLVMI